MGAYGHQTPKGSVWYGTLPWLGEVYKKLTLADKERIKKAKAKKGTYTMEHKGSERKVYSV